MNAHLNIPLLSRVKHAMHRPTHDCWHGIVIERHIVESPGHTFRTTYKVRWIKPDGDPSDSVVVHEPQELVVIDPPAPPAPMNTTHASSP